MRLVGTLRQYSGYIYEAYNNPKKFESMNKNFDIIQVKNSNALIYKLILNEN